MERNGAIDCDRTDLHRMDLHPADLHRAGLLPPDVRQNPAGDANGDGVFEITASPLDPAWVDQTVEAARRAGVGGGDLACVKREAFRQYVGKHAAFERPR